MNDYERIARVIRYLDEHRAAQPRLSTLARVAGMSEFHFHRLFTAWAGTTPKHFLQCLTFEHVYSSLRRGKNTLDSAFEAGLSGPGRLHDLCVNLQAASPGEIKSGGAGWTIEAGFGFSPFGRCLVAQSPRGICHLSFVDGNPKAAWADLKALWPNAQWMRDDAGARALLNQIFRRNKRSRPTRLTAYVRGTEFQVRVWRALLHISPGQLTSYGRVASVIGQPTAARAVGSAVGSNPIACLIPCHRVIRETAALGDYRWGALRKRAMVAREAGLSCCPEKETL
ncbi:MAG TPA: methylated-DNA--[protein]-cysteine S-methyltransferase [Candidatus Baltobacteraceae bacterium]|jgi:AraC family transcriptional regulator of adaptative response/methylated-DNA-[protein]-cysteine methyltransferase|nr:methylated-DNA--[protein]-cysteine S-methyltransferase [Candidatus Baltobacteraceae bacterium]